jgi:hypothetical protein
MKTLSAQEIEVMVSKEEYFTAENVMFSTSFTYWDKDSMSKKLAVNNKELLDFFERNQLKIIRSLEADSVSGDFEYKSPVYQVQMNHDQYLLFEKYRDNHSEVGGIAYMPTFSNKDKEKLLSDLTIQAWRQADEIAIKKGLVLKNEYHLEEIVEKMNSWIIGPPSSARYDHFKQPLKATYKFIFKTL